MLGRLRMSVADCITTYLALSDRVFRKIGHDNWDWSTPLDHFDSEELVRVVRDLLKVQGLSEDALLQGEIESGCKV